MLFIGCGDLALSMGLGSQIDGDEIERASIQVAQAAWAECKHFALGGAATCEALARRMLGLGPTMLTAGSEQGLLVQSVYRQAEVLANI